MGEWTVNGEMNQWSHGWPDSFCARRALASHEVPACGFAADAAAGADARRCAGGPRRGSLDAGVELDAGDQSEARHVAPKQQHDHAADGAVRDVVVAEADDVEAKSQ